MATGGGVSVVHIPERRRWLTLKHIERTEAALIIWKSTGKESKKKKNNYIIPRQVRGIFLYKNSLQVT